MITHTSYQCEVCRAIFFSEEDALKCEASTIPVEPTHMVILGEAYRSPLYDRQATAVEFVLVNISCIGVPIPGHRWEVRMDRPIKDSDHGNPCMVLASELVPA